MIYIPLKIKKRIVENLKKYQRIIKNATVKDVNESDTAVIVTDMISDIFGYDKYSDISTETAINGTYCDLGISINKKIKFLIELKAIGLELKDNHIKQAVDYAVNKGINWAILTNAREWHIYKVVFAKPIGKELVCEFQINKMNTRSEKDIETLFSLTKEGISKSALDDFYDQSQTTNKYVLGNLLTSDEIILALKREIRKCYPNTRINENEIKESLIQHVIKRELLEGEEADLARKKVKRKIKK